jgi:predicted ribosomally synthesized peptide with SipW-like signal peptide
MTSKNKFLAAGALGVAALGLVGVGTGASFTDAVHTTQKVTAGTLNMQLSTTASGASVSNDGKTVSFKDLGPTQSTFSSGAQPATITNAGNISANAIQLSASDVRGSDPASDALRNELYVRIISPIGGGVAYDGTLTGLEANPLTLTGPVPPNGGTDSFTTEFYAGGGQAPSLNNAAEGGVVTPTITVTYSG